jgi:hypothetical protein
MTAQKNFHLGYPSAMIRPVQNRCLHESLGAHAGHFLRKKNYISAAKKIAQKKQFAILTELAEKRFAIRQAGQRLDLQPTLIP